MKEDDPEVVAELLSLHEMYEEALVSNNVPVLDALFWDSPQVIRFGATENLYGVEELREFRKNRPSTGLERTVVNLQISTFGHDYGVTTVEFVRKQQGREKSGRQTQCWVRFAGGWRIVSAHVSFLPETVA
jgi:hypothetical protein